MILGCDFSIKSFKTIVVFILTIGYLQSTIQAQEINDSLEMKKTPTQRFVDADYGTETILAKVADKTITVREFYERAEYTVRPKYAKYNSNIEKKIILNSLIAEKLLLLDRGGKSDLPEKELFKSIMLGRKEQVMRQLLLREEGFSKVILDSLEFLREFRLAGRTYDVKFINLNDDVEARYVSSQLKTDTVSLRQIYTELSDKNELPKYKVDWNNVDHPEISKILFSEDSLLVDQVFGPVKVGDSYLVFQVDGWTDKPAIGNDRVLRFKNVKEKLIGEKGSAIYDDFIRSVMKGKKIEFNRAPFVKLIKIFGDLYIKSKDDIEDNFLNTTIKNENEIDRKWFEISGDIEAIRNEALFTVDGEIWTVGMFEKERQKHPLVFRKSRLDKKNFAEQLKLSIVDMIRDKYLTEVAYERELDKEFIVKRISNMWSDATVSFYEQVKYLKENNVKEFFTYNVIKDVFTPYIDELQSRYSDQIEINVEEFNKIELTRIDFFAIQKYVPYPILVPAFPQITVDHLLDYGKKLIINE